MLKTELKQIIFGFSKPVSKYRPYAWLIQWVDNINYDHAYTKFSGKAWGSDFYYHNSGTRTNFMSTTRFKELNIEVEEYELTVVKEIYNRIGTFCVSREGKPYGIIQSIGKAIVCAVYLISFGHLKISNPFKTGDSVTDCIEEQAQILNQCLGLRSNLDLDTITVKPWRDFVAAIPGIKRIK